MINSIGGPFESTLRREREPPPPYCRSSSKHPTRFINIAEIGCSLCAGKLLHVLVFRDKHDKDEGRVRYFTLTYIVMENA